MPGLNASGHQCLNGIGGRRHEGAAREDNLLLKDSQTICCGMFSNSHVIRLVSHDYSIFLDYVLRL